MDKNRKSYSTFCRYSRENSNETSQIAPISHTNTHLFLSTSLSHTYTHIHIIYILWCFIDICVLFIYVSFDHFLSAIIHTLSFTQWLSNFLSHTLTIHIRLLKPTFLYVQSSIISLSNSICAIDFDKCLCFLYQIWW